MAHKIKVEFTVQGDDEFANEWEASRILRELADAIGAVGLDARPTGRILDVNGNTVGEYTYERD